MISYDAHIKKTNEEGLMDMHNTSENLILDLIDNAQVGHDGCPVILVGHCLGGLLMKELCVQAQVRVGLRLQDRINHGVQNFLANVQGFFCYGSPHHGTELANIGTFSKGPLFKGLTILNDKSARRNEKFRTSRQKYGWRTFGIGELLPVNLNKFRRGPTLKISDNVVGLESQLNEIREKLLTRGVQRLGIVGIGGIGKTTLAKIVFNAILGYFEYTCFLTEVKKMNPGSLRDEIKESLCFRGRRVTQAFKWRALKGKRVLIVLDDITDESHVQVITEDEDFRSPQKCTVIVTSRDRGFLIPEDFEFHFVEKLDYEDSEKLFCKLAFKGPEIRYESLVESFLEKCDSLPLAIEVAGRYLYKKSEEVWADALKKLGSHPLNGNATDKLTSILNMSYENLAPVEREMFLDVAHCVHGHKLSTMKRTWQMCGYERSDSGWENLLDKGLVLEVLLPKWWDVEGDSRYVIQMHELLRDLGLSKPCPDPQSGSHCNQENTPILKIGVNDLLIDIFKEADGLRNLLDSGWSYGEGHLTPNRSRLLKVKHLHRWISGLFISGREALRALEIRECKYLIFLPRSLGQLQSLEHLKIVKCANLEHVPELLGLLSNLKYLTIQDCESLSTLPESLGELTSLRQLVIQGCGSLETLPESLGQLQALKQLTISECSQLQTLPGTIDELQALQHLTIQGCPNLEALPKSLGELRALEHLTIDESYRLETLPPNFGKLPVLKHLKISDCYSLHTLPESIPLLPALELLTLQGCHSLEALPKSLGQLRSLQHLTLERCYSLVALPESLAQLRGLQQLTINCCQRLESLLWTFEFHKDLQRVTIQECEGLRFLPFGWPETLEQQPGCHVTIERCPIEDLQALKHLTIQCQSLEHLPKSFGFGKLPALEHLTMQECQCLKDIPESIEELGALTKLTIQECPSLEHLPDNIGRLRCLKYLAIQRCQNLKDLPQSIGHLQALERLTIQGCQSLKDLPQSIEELGVLTNLTIQECASLEHLPENIGRVQALKYLTIERCGNLKGLPGSIGHLQALERLTIQGCESLKDFPQSIEELGVLTNLTIQECASFQHLPENIGRVRTLKYLTIQRCQNLIELPGSIRDLQALQELRIWECPWLSSKSIGYLQSLEHLTIQERPRLSAPRFPRPKIPPSRLEVHKF